jgi:hypothetical protein
MKRATMPMSNESNSLERPARASMILFDLYADPDGQDFLGRLLAETQEEAEAHGARIFGGPVIAVGPNEPPPHRMPFAGPGAAGE